MPRLTLLTALLATLSLGSSGLAQTSLSGQVVLNGLPVFDAKTLPIPTVGTYLIAASNRLRGEYILTVEGNNATQTVHLLVEANQFDPGPTLQVLDNHSYNGAVIINNFRVLLPTSNAATTYLVMDVVGNIASNGSTVVDIQYQGAAGYGSALSTAGGVIPGNLSVVGSTGLAVNEWRVGIGTAAPVGMLHVVTWSDTTSGQPPAFNPADTVLAGESGQGGGVYASYNQSTNVGFIGSLSPSVAWRSLVFNVGGGNVGIGTTTPGSDLTTLPSHPAPTTSIFEVNGDIALSQGNGGQMFYPDGTVQSTAWNGTTLGGDYAEAVDVLGDRAEYEPGDVIVIDSAEPGKFVKSDKAYSRLVAGVYSTKPGLVGRRTTADRPNKDAEVPMAMMGIVPTKVSAENGPIELGDLLVSASTPGYVMKGTDASRMMGAVIGKALAPFPAGKGIIETLISLQ